MGPTDTPHPVGAEIRSLQDLKGGEQHPLPPPSSPKLPGAPGSGGRAGTEGQTRQGSITPQHTELRQAAIACRELGDSFHVHSEKNQTSPFRALPRALPAEQHPWQLALRAQEGNALVGCRQAGGPAVPGQMDGPLTAEPGRCEGFGRGCKYCT